jgi:hypothetical protein
MNGNEEIIIPDELILNKIYQFREYRVMMDMDLAALYGVETKQLKRAVRRNIKRFPPDFIFELSQDELENLRSQFGTSSWGGLRYPPMAFTEQGIAMFSSILNSERAIIVNIRIIRIFVKMRELLLSQKEITAQLREIALRVENHDENILLILDYLKQLEQSRQQQDDQANRKRIGFRKEAED